MVSTDRPIQRVILPLEASSEERHALLPATVLASWFGAPLQLVTHEPEAVGHYVDVAGGLGVPVEPVVVLGASDFVADVAAHAGRHAPSICVTTLDERGLALARASDQASFLMGSQDTRRLAAGPLVMPLAGNDDDLDAVAVAATWANALELSVRLVVGTNPRAAERSE
ncbi:MAG: hypothetical protein OEV40_13875, partial [Acidimicrobiia bacterium]|nr:hypothetical protein [Acidimicrobiia bacterium]